MSSEIKLQTIYLLRRIGGINDKDIYIGSTSQPLQYRLKNHQYYALHLKDSRYSKYNLLYNRMLGIGINNWEIIPLQVTETDKNTALRSNYFFIIIINLI